jgi:hypothetical protein
VCSSDLVSPYAFKMVVGIIILLAISTSNLDPAKWFGKGGKA